MLGLSEDGCGRSAAAARTKMRLRASQQRCTAADKGSCIHGVLDISMVVFLGYEVVLGVLARFSDSQEKLLYFYCPQMRIIMCKLHEVF
jgi:hypothetical protein